MSNLRLTLRCPIDGCQYKARRKASRVNGRDRERGRCPRHNVWLVRSGGNTTGGRAEQELLTDITGCDV